MIITVKKFNSLNCFAIYIYIPQTCRKWVAYMYMSDLWKLDFEFQEKIFSYKLWE